MFEPNETLAVDSAANQCTVADLDFTMIRMKLADVKEGKGWDQETLDYVEGRYRKFLTLNLKYPELDIVPTGDIDSFWHAHILDTKKYQVDCINLFGKMLHHYPYFGMLGDADAKDLADAFEQTKEIWSTQFGETYTDSEDSPEKCRKSCRTACKPQNCKKK